MTEDSPGRSTSDSERVLSGGPLPIRDELNPEDRSAVRAAARGSITGYGPLADALRLEHERDEARAAYRRAIEERDQLRTSLGAVYTERARLVAFLAACYESARYLDQDDDEYRLVYIKTPAGQMSWHVRGDDAETLLAHVPHGEDDDLGWDGHTTEVKYERLADMTDRIHRAGGLAGVIASVAAPERTEPYPTAVERGELRAERDEARAQLAKAGELIRSLERMLTGWSRGMYSARIDCVRGDVKAAIETLGEGLDGYDGTEWDGKETGAQWWERTKAEEAGS